MKLPKDVTAGELELLAMVLREVRNVQATGEQLSIHVDPCHPLKAGGASVCFAYNGRGHQWDFEGVRTRKSARPKR